MQVSNLVRPSALAVRVTEVAEGSVYKRIDKPAYGEQRLVFGVVTDVLHDGQEAAIIAVEFTQGAYANDYAPRVKTFSGDTEMLLYPATPEEFQAGMAEAIESQQRTVEAAERDLASKRSILTQMQAAAARPVAPATTESITA